MSTAPALLLSVVLLLGNAFFVAAEFALISARRSSIEPRAQAGGRAAGTALKAMENVSVMMAGAQLGITVCSLGLGYLGEPAIAHLLEDPFHDLGLPASVIHPVALILALSLIGVLHVVLGEIIPKNVALAGPDRAVLLLAPPLTIVVRMLRPAIAGINLVANSVLRAVGVEPRDEVTSAFTRDEVAGLVDESRREGLLDRHEEHLLTGALAFDERDARSVLLPNDRLQTVAPDITPHELEQVAARTGYSRYPVRRDGALIGYLHLKDVLEFEDRHRNRPIAEPWIRPLIDVQANDSLRAVLATMQRSGAHLAQVVDGTRPLGVAALEDVVEELVGEIRDEASSGPSIGAASSGRPTPTRRGR
jgi:CBS domain containing-hemolysin-like protein